MSFLGNISTAFQKWATDQINAIKASIGVVPFSKVYTSPAFTITSGGPSFTANHTLGVVPKLLTFKYVCIVADLGYSVGDTLYAGGVTGGANGSANGNAFACWMDASTINVKFGTGGQAILHKTNGNLPASAAPNAWQFVITAYA